MAFYGTVAGADTYNADRGRTEWATYTEQQKEEALTRATDYLDQMFRYQLKSGMWVSRWSGEMVDYTTPQARDWPRNGALRYDTYPVPDGTTPADIDYATYEAAYLEAGSPGYLTPVYSESESKGSITQETVGPITIKYQGITGVSPGYDDRPPNMPIVFQVERLAAPYLKPTASFYDIGVRTV